MFKNPFQKSSHLRDNAEKYCRAEKATDDNMAHAHCMMDTQGYRYKLRICNTYSFSTVIMVERTRVTVTLHAHWLPCHLLLSIIQYFYSSYFHPLYHACAYYHSVRHILTLLWTLHASYPISPLPPHVFMALCFRKTSPVYLEHTSGRSAGSWINVIFL
jgi:hypothetical protein